MKSGGIGLVLLGVAMVLVAPLACSKHQPSPASEKQTIHVLCSTFPIYLFTRAVTEGRANVQVAEMLPAAMGCPHDYTLTPQDMRKIADANVFVANGLGMEEFLGEPIKRANDKILLIDTSAGIGDLIQITPEEHEEQEEAHEGHHHHAGANPHLFASPRMAARIVRRIAAEFSKIDPAGQALYTKNAEAYAASLDKLADDFAAALKNAPNKRIVTEHAVFDYLARDCRLEIVAVMEEHPGQEPSASGMLEIVRKIKASGTAAVFTEPQYPAKVGRTIAQEAGVPVAVLDPVASGPEDATPDYYEKTMRANLATLVEILGSKAK
jgi:ABC-type Zn uptake system ZnuABC Zn-binding protein ZnuA